MTFHRRFCCQPCFARHFSLQGPLTDRLRSAGQALRVQKQEAHLDRKRKWRSSPGSPCCLVLLVYTGGNAEVAANFVQGQGWWRWWTPPFAALPKFHSYGHAKTCSCNPRTSAPKEGLGHCPILTCLLNNFWAEKGVPVKVPFWVPS